jgi:hypothetical protein
MADMQSHRSGSREDQTTVLAGPGRNISLTACAQQIMAQAGLTCLLDTKLSFIGDHGQAVPVKVDPAQGAVTLLGSAPESAKWLVVEHFADGSAPRGWLFRSKEGAAAHFGVKLVMQREGAVTVEQPESKNEPTIRFKGEGNSGLSGLIMTHLSA